MTDLNQLHQLDFNEVRQRTCPHVVARACIAQSSDLWVEEIKTAIHNRDLEAMDWDNLLDEIDDKGA